MRAIFWGMMTMAAVWTSIGLAAQPSATDLSVEAQKECDLGRQAVERTARLTHFEKSQALAERAIKLDDRSADAHFALFCSLGEQMRIDGETFSTSSVFGFRKMMKALDRTLQLNPEHLDALSSKGTFLVRLPALLGGDAAKGEDMLRRVIQRAPNAINARMTLARSYAARGHADEAMALAQEALRLAEADNRLDLLPEARMLVTELGGRYGERLARP